MARTDGLKPIQKGQLSSDELKQRQHNGGVKSGEARRAKKTLKQELEILMEMATKDGKTYQELMSLSLVKEALKGNTKAFEVVRDTLGQKPIEVQQVTNVPVIEDDIK